MLMGLTCGSSKQVTTFSNQALNHLQPATHRHFKDANEAKAIQSRQPRYEQSKQL